jgi:hypothetical protein
LLAAKMPAHVLVRLMGHSELPHGAAGKDGHCGSVTADSTEGKR